MSYTLDKTDIRLIRCFKREKKSLESLRKVWGEEYEIPTEYVEVRDITEHLLTLALKLGLLSEEGKFVRFMFSLDPKKNFEYVCAGRSYITDEETDYQIILLSRLDSLFRRTAVADLPGYSVDKEV